MQGKTWGNWDVQIKLCIQREQEWRSVPALTAAIIRPPLCVSSVSTLADTNLGICSAPAPLLSQNCKGWEDTQPWMQCIEFKDMNMKVCLPACLSIIDDVDYDPHPTQCCSAPALTRPDPDKSDQVYPRDSLPLASKQQLEEYSRTL